MKYYSVAFNSERYHKELEEKVSLFTAKFMSDTKWLKLFTRLSQQDGLVKKCLIKHVWNDIPVEIVLPSPAHLNHTFYKKGIMDVITGGPMLFKEIEYISFPSTWAIPRKMRTEKLAPFEYTQDIIPIKKIIDETGTFEIELQDGTLIVYGYR